MCRPEFFGRYARPDIHKQTMIIGKNGAREIQRQGKIPGAYCKTIDNLKHSLQTGRPSELDSSHALINMQIIMAAYKSAWTHKAVQLPFEPELNPLEQWMEESRIK